MRHKLLIFLAVLFGLLAFILTYKQLEAEKAKILREDLGGNKPSNMQRSKGLGENEPEMMAMTTMNPETRRLIKVMPEDAERTAHYFDMLLGDNLSARKEFININGHDYLEMADIS